MPYLREYSCQGLRWRHPPSAIKCFQTAPLSRLYGHNGAVLLKPWEQSTRPRSHRVTFFWHIVSPTSQCWQALFPLVLRAFLMEAYGNPSPHQPADGYHHCVRSLASWPRSLVRYSPVFWHPVSDGSLVLGCTNSSTELYNIRGGYQCRFSLTALSQSVLVPAAVLALAPFSPAEALPAPQDPSAGPSVPLLRDTDLRDTPQSAWSPDQSVPRLSMCPSGGAGCVSSNALEPPNASVAPLLWPRLLSRMEVGPRCIPQACVPKFRLPHPCAPYPPLDQPMDQCRALGPAGRQCCFACSAPIRGLCSSVIMHQCHAQEPENPGWQTPPPVFRVFFGNGGTAFCVCWRVDALVFAEQVHCQWAQATLRRGIFGDVSKPPPPPPQSCSMKCSAFRPCGCTL